MALFDEGATETKAEKAARRRREKAAAANGNGNGVKGWWKDAKSGNGANAVTTASFEDDTVSAGDVTVPSQPTYPGYVPPVFTPEPAEAYGDRFQDDVPDEDVENQVHVANTYFGRMAESDPDNAYKIYEEILSGDQPEAVKNAYREQAPASFADRYNAGLAQGAQGDMAAFYADRDAPKPVDDIGSWWKDAKIPQEIDPETGLPIPGTGTRELPVRSDQTPFMPGGEPPDRTNALLDLIEKGDLTEGDIADMGLPPEQTQILRQAFSDKKQREWENLEKGRDAQSSFADSFADRDTEGPEIDRETGKILDTVESTTPEVVQTRDTFYGTKQDEAPDQSRMERLVGLVNDGSLTEGDIADMGLNPEEQTILTTALANKRKAEEDEEAGRRAAQESYAATFEKRDEGPEIDPETGLPIVVRESDEDVDPVEDSVSKIDRLVGLVGDGTLTEGDIADLELNPHERRMLENAFRQKQEQDQWEAEEEERRITEERVRRSETAYNSFEGRFLNDPNKPSEHDIITNRDLTQEQKDNLLSRYFPEDDVPDEVAEVEGGEELSDRDRYGRKLNATRDFLNSGGDPAMVNWNELESLAGLAGVSDLFNKQRIIESGAAEYDKQNRPKRQEKNYNDLIGKFMSGGVVSPHELATSDLNEQQRKDLQGRLDEQTRRQNAEIERKKEEERRREIEREQQAAYESDLDKQREEQERLRIEEQQSEMQNPTINTSDKAERSVAYNTLYDKIVVGRNDPSQLPSLYEIETSQLSADEKARLKGMLPKDPPTLDEQAAQQEADEAESKSAEEYAAATAGKEIIGEDSLRDIIADVMSNLAQIGSEEDIIALVNARLQGQNLFADSATVLNTVADVNKFYYKQFQGTRSRPLTFVERKELEAEERSDSVVTADEIDSSVEVNALFTEFGIAYEMQKKPEEAYAKAIEGGASASDAYRIFKLAGGMGAPPQGRGGMLPDEPIGDDDSISVFTISEEHGGYGHPFYADDVYNLKSRPGESEEAFWDRVEDAEWLTELKDPDTAASYSQISLSESDAIVDKMISTLGKNAEDSVTLTNALDELVRFQNKDDFTKSDLRGLFEEALTDALESMGGEDLDEQKRMLRESARSDYDDALEEANRYFLVNGLSGSGQEQRRFEELSSEHLKGLREIDMAINEKRNEYAAKQVTLLTDSLSQLANIDVTEDKLGLDAEDLEERGRQFDASLKQSRYTTDEELSIRNKELNIDETKFYETVRQFNKEMGNKINEFAAQFGLSEMETAASIRKVNTDIVNQTRELSNQIAMSWADITGVAGDMAGDINLNDLGIPATEFTEEVRNLPAEYLAQTKVGKTVMDSFAALTGQQLTLDQLKGLVDGEDIGVTGMPTLESRQIATAITMQNLDRMNKYSAIATENGLELERFERAKDEADRGWYLSIGDVSETFGLSNNAFRDAKFAYDKMFDPLSPDPTRNGDEDPDLIHRATEKARDIYMSSARVEPGTDEYNDAANTFEEKWDQANQLFDQTHGNQLKDIAQQNKFEEDKFRRANEQADRQEDKYNDVWGALMGARDKNPTAINLYQSNRRLWNDTIQYIDEYTDAGTTMTPEMAGLYRQLVGQPIDPKMTELMAKYDSLGERDGLTVGQINSMVEDWGNLSPENKKRDDENEMQYRIRASGEMQRHRQTVDAANMVARMDSGELKVLDADSTHAIVSSLMENPPPGLFEDINSTYGILNDEAKRDVLTGIVNASISNRQMEQYRDEETGELKMTYEDIGLDWINEDGSWKDDSNWFDDGGGWFSRGIRAVGGQLAARTLGGPYLGAAVGLYGMHQNLTADERMLDKFVRRSGPGGKLEGVSLVDLLQNDEYKNYRDDEGEFEIKREGRAKLMEFNGAFNSKFGRNPTVREAMLFRATGTLDLESDDPSVGYVTSVNVRLVPENWIDNYNEPGQLEGIFALLNGGNVTPERAVARTSGWAKFGNIAGGLAGAAIGAYVGGPAGAKAGFGVGSAVGSTVAGP